MKQADLNELEIKLKFLDAGYVVHVIRFVRRGTDPYGSNVRYSRAFESLLSALEFIGTTAKQCRDDIPTNVIAFVPETAPEAAPWESPEKAEQ